MRQFYDEERIFRITGKSGESEFVRFSGQVLRATCKSRGRRGAGQS